MQEEQDGKGLFKKLRKLFSTDVIIRNVGGKQLKVIDTDNLQISKNARRVHELILRRWSCITRNAFRIVS